jgi:hypothetical protein
LTKKPNREPDVFSAHDEINRREFSWRVIA